MQNSEIIYFEKQFEHGRRTRKIYILKQAGQNNKQIYRFLEQNQVRVLVNVGQNKLYEKINNILYEEQDNKLDKYFTVAKYMHNELFKYHNDVAIISGQSLNNGIKLYLLFMKIFEGISREQYSEHSKQLSFLEISELQNFINKYLYYQQQDKKNNNEDKILRSQEYVNSEYIEPQIDYSQQIIISNCHLENQMKQQDIRNNKKFRIISVETLNDNTNQKKQPNSQQDQNNKFQENIDDTFQMFMPPKIYDNPSEQSDEIIVNVSESIGKESQINQIYQSKHSKNQLIDSGRTYISVNGYEEKKNQEQFLVTAESSPFQQNGKEKVLQLPQPIKLEVFKPKTNFVP